MSRIKLGINIDHIATLRQARGGDEPSVLQGAEICCDCKVDGITMHLREDRRHIQDKDIRDVKKGINCKLNLEMALAENVIAVAREVKPDMITLVPERREELTTEGGLNVTQYFNRISEFVKEFQSYNIPVSLFIEPDKEVIKASSDCGAQFIEIHTGSYANAIHEEKLKKELHRIYEAAEYAVEKKVRVNAGHGLNYNNVKPILKCSGLEELNIGHSIISHAMFVGLGQAVKEMQNLLVF